MNEKTGTGRLLIIMTVLAWVVLIGFMIEAGAILFSYFVSCVNPEAAKNLYKGLNLYDLRQLNFWRYTVTVFFFIAEPVMKASVCLMITKTISKINLKNPSRV